MGEGTSARTGELGTVAVLSDVHGVLPVLEAVLAEPDVRAADAVVVTGDHAAGPQPVAVLDRLRALGDPRTCRSCSWTGGSS
ncbi:metallophosphoesterase family protein [Isoptericola sp. NPDC019571]|uniref:metallophosphoesterase family protein n=1 Tax=Isoptericola sp. NPDC019571 TaxID=3364008 RepID=UPI00379E9878